MIHAIVTHKGSNIEEFEKIRQNKKARRGGFEEKVYLINVCDFLDVWDCFLKTIQTGEVIYTLAHHAPNTIVGINEEGIIVRTNDNPPQLVHKEWIEAAWSTLIENGSMIRDELPAPAIFRSSFIMVLLTRIECVGFEIDPITLYLTS